MSEIVEVTQADRQRMVLYEQMSAIPIASSFAREVLDGKWDDDRRVQSFARHRIAAEARSHDGEWEAMREAFNEALWAGWRSGLAGEQMDDNHAAKAWAASDAAAKASALPLFDEGRL